MSGYLIAQVNIINEEPYKEYIKQTSPIVKKHGGKFLVRGGKNISQEGSSSPRTIIAEFPSYEDAVKCYNSNEYQEAYGILKGFVKRNLQIIEGT